MGLRSHGSRLESGFADRLARSGQQARQPFKILLMRTILLQNPHVEVKESSLLAHSFLAVFRQHGTAFAVVNPYACGCHCWKTTIASYMTSKFECFLETEDEPFGQRFGLRPLSSPCLPLATILSVRFRSHSQMSKNILGRIGRIYLLLARYGSV